MRRKKEVSIPADPAGTQEARKNRDAGKVYILTEMPASAAERWANRAIIALGNSGAKIDYVVGAGMAGIAVLGLRAMFGVAEGPALELTDELMGCVTRKMEHAPEGRPLVEDDVEEVSTRFKLKAEVFALHTGFSWAEIRSMLISAGHQVAEFEDTQTTSRRRSVTSSRPEKRRSRTSKRS